MLDAFPAAVIAFAFNEGAYCAETMRGALESVPQGQLEAFCAEHKPEVAVFCVPRSLSLIHIFGKLGCVGRFAVALQAAEHDDGLTLVLDDQAGGFLAAHQRCV